MKTTIRLILCCFLFIIFPKVIFAADPLPAAQAFQLQTKVIDPNTLQVHWTIAPGYFLYRDRLHFNLVNEKQANVGTIILPIGKNKTDPEIGTFQVFHHKVAIPVPILGVAAGTTKLIVAYQGCSDAGFCYPPNTATLRLNINNNLELDGVAIEKAVITATSSTTSTQISAIFATKSVWLILLSFFGLGLLLSFTPCVLPMIPVLSGIIVGHGKNITTRKAFTLSLIYVLSMSFTYAIAGVIVALLGANLQTALQNPWVISVFSLLFVLLALSMFGFYDLRMPAALEARLANISRKQQHGAYFGAAIMGCLATLILSPCVTAPLVGALTYIAQTGNAVLGASALFILSLGMGTPLLLIGTSAGKILPKTGKWMNTIKSLFGVMLLAVAIYLLERVIPASITMALWAALLIISAIFMGAVRRNYDNNWQKLWQGAGIIMLIYGILIIIGIALGNDNLLQPLAGLTLNGKTENAIKSNALNFQTVKSIADVKAALRKARRNDKPVMLDFYADWCLSCKVMEKTTLADAQVKNILQNFVLLKADVTANTLTDKALEKYFAVIAPPTYLFFDKTGKEVSAARIIGEADAKQFLVQAGRAISRNISDLK